MLDPNLAWLLCPEDIHLIAYIPVPDILRDLLYMSAKPSALQRASTRGGRGGGGGGQPYYSHNHIKQTKLQRLSPSTTHNVTLRHHRQPCVEKNITLTNPMTHGQIAQSYCQ